MKIFNKKNIIGNLRDPIAFMKNNLISLRNFCNAYILESEGYEV